MPTTKHLLHRVLPLLTATALLAVPAAPAAASSDQQSIIQDDSHLQADPAGTLAQMRLLGADRVRVTVRWDMLAPRAGSHRRPGGFRAASPGAYPQANWASYDAIVNDARHDGLKLDFTLTGPAPLWATGPGAPGAHFGQWKPSAREYDSFVRAVATRYSGSYTPPGASSPLPRVDFWAIWNEPNYGVDLAPQATHGDTIEVGAASYRGLVDAAWTALHGTGHGRDTILIGETAPRGLDHPIGDFSGTKPLRFLRALYCVDSRQHQLRGYAAGARGCPTTAAGSRRFRAAHPGLFGASGFADHPYEQGVAPNTPTTSNPRRFKSDPDYADLPELPRLERLLDTLNRTYGSRTRFPIYSTEYGYATRPPDPGARISPATAADYINWAEYLSWRQPRVRSYMQYLLFDPPSGSFASGLELANGAHKATYDAYRLALYLPVTSSRRGRTLELWGCVRAAGFAALDTGAPQRVQIQFRPSSKGAFRTSTITIRNSDGYFDVRQAFVKSGEVRLAWTDQTGAIVHSRTVGITMR
ncbi:MAG: hypothetical protein ACR2IP_14600 [Solirubrobacteraceae bacterium]